MFRKLSEGSKTFLILESSNFNGSLLLKELWPRQWGAKTVKSHIREIFDQISGYRGAQLEYAKIRI